MKGWLRALAGVVLAAMVFASDALAQAGGYPKQP
jgi:hypothetical protein